MNRCLREQSVLERKDASMQTNQKNRDEDEPHRAPDKLEQAFDGLEQEAPDTVARAIRWLRDPAHRWIRLPIGMALIALGFLGFLPVIGFELIPIGLLLIAQDVPVLREPMGRLTLWLEEKWRQLRRRWQRRRNRD